MTITKTTIQTFAALMLIAVPVIVGAWWGMTGEDSSICRHLTIRIEDGRERQYVEAGEMIVLLRQQQLYPVGKPMRQIPLQQIEEAVLSHTMVRTAQCYATGDSTIVVRLTQRIPLLKVTTATESYYVDTDRERMPLSAKVNAEVIAVTGRVGERMAKDEIADFVLWLKDNTYWSVRIVRIDIMEGKQLLLYQADQQPRIVLGRLEGYEDKLHRVRLFQETLPVKLPDAPTYKELDVRYKGQVVGRK